MLRDIKTYLTQEKNYNYFRHGVARYVFPFHVGHIATARDLGDAAQTNN